MSPKRPTKARQPKRDVRPPRSAQDLARAMFAQADRKTTDAAKRRADTRRS